MHSKKELLNEIEIENIIDEMSKKVFDDIDDVEKFAIVGIQTRGVEIANRIKSKIESYSGKTIPSGDLDITFYRDDLATRGVLPVMKEPRITFKVTKMVILRGDDVIFTGRTIKAALDTISSFGRPMAIKFLALVDRGNREFPIQPDYSGFKIDTGIKDEVKVRLNRTDDMKDSVFLING